MTDYTLDRHAYVRDLASASFALMPSWHEGFGLVAWEAIACEVPVVVGQQSGVYRFLKERMEGTGLGRSVRAVAVNGQTAEEVGDAPYTEQDVQSLSQQITELMARPADSKQYAKNLRAILIRQGVTWEIAAQETLNCIGQKLPVALQQKITLNAMKQTVTTAPADEANALHIPAWLRLPVAQLWSASSGMPPSALLMARDAVVAFDSVRMPDLQTLHGWCDAQVPTPACAWSLVQAVLAKPASPWSWHASCKPKAGKAFGWRATCPAIGARRGKRIWPAAQHLRFW